MTAIWLDSAPVPPFVHVSGGASFREADVYVTCDGTYVAYEVYAPGFLWKWNESPFPWDDDVSPDWYINQVYHSICTQLGADAWDAIHDVTENLFSVSEYLWYSAHPAGNFRVLSFWGQNTNDFYDPEKSFNGGGYWQPSGGCLVDVNGVEVVVDYDKFDCGDFGCRRSYTVDAPGFRWSWRESNMDGDGGAYYVPYDSISGVLGVDAEEMLDAVREAVQLASSLGWQSDDPDSFSDEEDAI